jgi:hypothetical protein
MSYGMLLYIFGLLCIAIVLGWHLGRESRRDDYQRGMDDANATWRRMRDIRAKERDDA